MFRFTMPVLLALPGVLIACAPPSPFADVTCGEEPPFVEEGAPDSGPVAEPQVVVQCSLSQPSPGGSATLDGNPGEFSPGGPKTQGSATLGLPGFLFGPDGASAFFVAETQGAHSFVLSLDEGSAEFAWDDDYRIVICEFDACEYFTP